MIAAMEAGVRVLVAADTLEALLRGDTEESATAAALAVSTDGKKKRRVPAGSVVDCAVGKESKALNSEEELDLI